MEKNIYIAPDAEVLYFNQESPLLTYSEDGNCTDGLSKGNDFDRDLDNYKDVEIPVDHYNPWED